MTLSGGSQPIVRLGRLSMETVLVVDTRSRRKTLRSLLISAGYQVEFAHANSDLIEIMRSDSPNAVLLTWPSGKTLPLATCTAVRHASADVPIIVLGPRTQTVAKVRLFEVGADDFLEEPFDDLELVARLRSLIRRSKLSAKSST
jgi:DNA-binding response OmpR family regulator